MVPANHLCPLSIWHHCGGSSYAWVQNLKDDMISNGVWASVFFHAHGISARTELLMELPSGGDNYDGPRVHQVCVKQSPPPTAVQVGGLDHVRVGVDPEHSPTVGIHCQTLWTDQIYTAKPSQHWAWSKQQQLLWGRLVRVITGVNEYFGLSSRCHCCSVDSSCRQICPVDMVLFAVIG